MLEEKIKKAIRNYYKIQKNYYNIKKPKKPHIGNYMWHLEQLDKIGEIDYLHYCSGIDECVDVYFDDNCIFHIFHDGNSLLVLNDFAYSGTFSYCLEKLKEYLTKK